MGIKLQWPLPENLVTVSQRFGENPAFYSQFGLAGHEGTDYPCPVGTPVYATHAGDAISAWGPDYGNQVWIRYGDVTTLAAHLSQVYVSSDSQWVEQGEVIGLSGDMGRWVTGPHLHLGLQLAGVGIADQYGPWIDPEPFLRRDAMYKTTIQTQNIEPWMGDTLQDWGIEWWKGVNPPNDDPFPWIQNKVVRVWTDDVDWGYIQRGQEGGRDFVRNMVRSWASRLYTGNVVYSLANEPSAPGDPGLNSNENIRLFTEYSIGAMREANSLGIRLVIGEWAEGNWHDNGTGDESVTKWKVQQFIPAVRDAIIGGHYIGRHCYWRPEVEGPLGDFHALGRLDKDVQWWEEAGVNTDGLQVLVTEAGIDGGIAGHTPKEGWRTFVRNGAMTAQEYFEQVARAEQWARERSWCKQLFLFVSGFSDPWGEFDIDEAACSGIVQAIDYLAIPPVGNIAEGIRQAAWDAIGIPYNPDAAFGRYAAEHDLGRPVTTEKDLDGHRFQAFDQKIIYALIGDWDNIKEIDW